MISVRIAELRVGFDLDEVLVADQRRGDERVGGQDRAETRAVGPGHGLPVGDVLHEHARAHDVRERRAERLQRAFDLVDREVRLRGGDRARRSARSPSVAVVPDTLMRRPCRTARA